MDMFLENSRDPHLRKPITKRLRDVMKRRLIVFVDSTPDDLPLPAHLGPGAGDCASCCGGDPSRA